MKRFLFYMQMIAISATSSIINAQSDCRFGFEYNEGGYWIKSYHEQLLARLAKICPKGEINVNLIGGGWARMQVHPDSAINFNETDSVVTLFQRHGFALAWNLRSDAPWAFPSKQIPSSGTAAPDPVFEEHWKRYIKTIVERYDGDGINDMPGLSVPIRSYIMIGEIKFGKTGTGDQEKGPFWFDTIDNLLRLHHITYTSVHEADFSGNSSLISSGALLWDLFADFPDYPEFDPADSNSTIQRRLSRRENFKRSKYTAGWDSLKKMLTCFGNDADGIECDYIGWHPHFSWRIIDQEFSFIHANAGNKPIYVDDMWSNLFPIGYAAIPGEAQFTASRPANRTWVKAINGDFPNTLFTSNDPYGELFQKLSANNQTVLAWYYANGARRLVKSFASAFGEGAEYVSFSGTNDALFWGLRNWEGGWINLLGLGSESYPEKPQYYTYKLLIEKLHDFTKSTEISVSNDPRTRVYKFNRPRGPIYVLWSETGEAPPNLDYNIPTGETVSFTVESDTLMLTHIITNTANTTPEIDMQIIQKRQVTIKLGYNPIFLEPILSVRVGTPDYSWPPGSFLLEQNYPNPFNPCTAIEYQLPCKSNVEISIFNLQGQKVVTLVQGYQAADYYKIIWDGRDESGCLAASGVYFCQLKAGKFMQMKKMLLFR